MNEKPIISIIIPAYNAETTLKRCVRSVLIQDYEEYEIMKKNTKLFKSFILRIKV